MQKIDTTYLLKCNLVLKEQVDELIKVIDASTN